eukprot:TRINITY_DN48430_c0_g1_i1.p1 TRINITY_DN48430_c0_g1~~TRINITY_DN48430_c0_g1_i1.p1  ORF type:complete len:549 (+),score=79.56 TRINITY_DN48430_c0_g1_i1:50-1648(+)
MVSFSSMYCISLTVFCYLYSFVAANGAAEVDTYGYASIGLERAQTPAFYKVFESGEEVGQDAHPVHGLETSDGGFLLVGQSWEIEGKPDRDMFAIKTNAKGEKEWIWRSRHLNNDDAALNAAQLPTGDLIVAGFRQIDNSTYHRALVKLSLETGKQLWVATFDDTPMSQGVIEVLNVVQHPGSEGLLCGGGRKISSGINPKYFIFKSAGKPEVDGATSFVMKLPMSALISNTAPDASSISWIKDFSPYKSTHAVQSIRTTGDVVAMLWGVGTDEKYAYSLVRLTATGANVWGPQSYWQVPVASDMLVASDGSGIIASGYKRTVNPAGDHYTGCIAKFGMSGGGVEWIKTFSGGGIPELMYNECWGMAENQDGYVIGCGWGMENCENDKLNASFVALCKAGKGDRRAGAVPSFAANWRSLVVQTDKSGNVLWQRVDKHKSSGSSASEYVVAMKNGGIMSVNDEVGGAGLLVLSPRRASASESIESQCQRMGNEACAKHPTACASQNSTHFLCDYTCKLHGSDMKCNITHVKLD